MPAIRADVTLYEFRDRVVHLASAPCAVIGANVRGAICKGITPGLDHRF